MRSLSLIPLLLLLAAPASAHEGLPATLDRLDHRIEDAPNDLDLRLRRAESRRLHRDLQGALEDLKTAAGLAPDDPRVVLERGLVQHELGNTAAARTDLDRYLVLVPRAASGRSPSHPRDPSVAASQRARRPRSGYLHLPDPRLVRRSGGA